MHHICRLFKLLKLWSFIGFPDLLCAFSASKLEFHTVLFWCFCFVICLSSSPLLLRWGLKGLKKKKKTHMALKKITKKTKNFSSYFCISTFPAFFSSADFFFFYYAAISWGHYHKEHCNPTHAVRGNLNSLHLSWHLDFILFFIWFHFVI